MFYVRYTLSRELCARSPNKRMQAARAKAIWYGPPNKHMQFSGRHKVRARVLTSQSASLMWAVWRHRMR